jgi:hypothetical protein
VKNSYVYDLSDIECALINTKFIHSYYYWYISKESSCSVTLNNFRHTLNDMQRSVKCSLIDILTMALSESDLKWIYFYVRMEWFLMTHSRIILLCEVTDIFKSWMSFMLSRWSRSGWRWLWTEISIAFSAFKMNIKCNFKSPSSQKNIKLSKSSRNWCNLNSIKVHLSQLRLKLKREVVRCWENSLK